MAPVLQPVLREPPEHQFHKPTDKIGVVTFRQDQQARIVGQQGAPPSALLKVPANELVAILDVKGRSAPGRHPQPAALVSYRGTQLFAHQRSVVQIMMLVDELITPR